MRNPPQAGFDTADDDIHSRESFTRTLGIHRDGAVGAFVGFAIGGVGIVGTDLAVGRVAIDHRVHIARSDTKIKIGFAQRAKAIGGEPVRLTDNADLIALRLKQTADQGHAEARVVDVGIAGNQDDVAAVPAEHIHLGPRHRQKRRGRRFARRFGRGVKQVLRGGDHGTDCTGLAKRCSFSVNVNASPIVCASSSTASLLDSPVDRQSGISRPCRARGRAVRSPPDRSHRGRCSFGH